MYELIKKKSKFPYFSKSLSHSDRETHLVRLGHRARPPAVHAHLRVPCLQLAGKGAALPNRATPWLRPRRQAWFPMRSTTGRSHPAENAGPGSPVAGAGVWQRQVARHAGPAQHVAGQALVRGEGPGACTLQDERRFLDA